MVAGQALGYSRAHEVVVKHERIERHLNAARTIQLSMLPRETPQLADYSFCNHYIAAERVGGDYYFYEPLANGQIVFGIADASGKGLQASMQIVRFAGEVRLRIATCRTLKTVLEKLNQFVCSFDDSKFITSCICVLDPVKHQLTLANAGHLYPLWFHAQSGTVDKVVTANGGLPLGLDPKEKFHPVRISMKPGDRVVLYTDGISEAMNVDLEQYSTERLVEVIAESREPLPGLIQQIEQDVVRFRNGQDASDDVCVMGLERAPLAGQVGAATAGAIPFATVLSISAIGRSGGSAKRFLLPMLSRGAMSRRSIVACADDLNACADGGNCTHVAIGEDDPTATKLRAGMMP